MKREDFLKRLSDMTKITADKLKEVLSSDTEEVDAELEEVHIYTDDELESFKKNMTAEASKTAIEMAVKEQRNFLKETYGSEFDFQGKTMTNLLEAAIKAGEKKAGVKPNEQLAEKDKVIKALQENVKQLESEKVQILDEKNKVITEFDINSTITKAIPADIDTLWTPDDLSVLFKKDYQIVLEEGKKMVKRDGEIIRDKKTQEPISVETVVNTWLMEKGITKKPAQGRGDGDKTPKGEKTEFRNMDEINAYVDEKKLTNEQAVELLRKAMKDNPALGM